MLIGSESATGADATPAGWWWLALPLVTLVGGSAGVAIASPMAAGFGSMTAAAIAVSVAVQIGIFVALKAEHRTTGVVASMVSGLAALLGIFGGGFSVMAYDRGPGRTEWIGGIGVVATMGIEMLAAVVVALVVGLLLIRARTRGDTVGLLRWALAATWLGSGALLIQFFLIAYDVAPNYG